MSKAIDIPSQSIIVMDDQQEIRKIETNSVLLCKSNTYCPLTFCCPAYLRIKIKNFTDLDHTKLFAQINTTILLDIDTTDIPTQIKQQIKKNLILRFPKGVILKLKDQTAAVIMKEHKNDDREIINYTIRKTLKTEMVPEVFWTPFERIYLILSITVQKIEIDLDSIHQQTIKEINRKFCQLAAPMRDPKPNLVKEEEEEEMLRNKIQIKFNLMNKNTSGWIDEEGNQVVDCQKIAFTNCTFFGDYDLAEKLLDVDYTNKNTAKKLKELNDIRNSRFLCDLWTPCYKYIVRKIHASSDVKYQASEKGQINSYQYAHFQIPIYRLPFISLLTIFLPLWFLGLLNIGIFFQENQLSERIASIATVMIAYVALLPVIRGQLPLHPRVTFVQYLVYLQMFTSSLCLAESLRIREGTEKFEWQTNVFFMLSVYIQIIEIVVVLVWVCIYGFCCLPMYNAKSGPEKIYIHPDEWKNPHCNNQFSKISEQFNIYKGQTEIPMKKQKTKNNVRSLQVIEMN